MAAKRCFRCQRVLDLTEFYGHPRSSDGLMGKCKRCHCADTDANRRRKLEDYARRERERYHGDRAYREKKLESSARWRAANREVVKRNSSAWSKRNPEKVRARLLVAEAIRRGELVRGRCADCGVRRGIQGHHEDYSRPLEVTWLCVRCHSQRHVEIREAQRQA